VKAVFLGATKGMGRAVARSMAERGDAVFLLGREPGELERSVTDLQIRGAGGRVGFAICNLLEPAGFAPALEEAAAALGGFDVVVVSAGAFATQDQLEKDVALRDELLITNFVNTVHFCEEARTRLLASGGGTLAVFSSVSGDRARKKSVLYGASKAGLTHYLTGLDHKFRQNGLRTVLVKPGFVRTGMTASLDPPPFSGEPRRVARDVLRAIDHGRPLVYSPPVWRVVMLVMRSLPRAVMRRIEF
jgi:short-subunit dehydrogenase